MTTQKTALNPNAEQVSKTIHRANMRGHANHGWLNSHHTFSFAGYYDPQRMGFGSLRVINDDVVDGGAGFPTHSHKNMEIISIPISGALAHRDSEGNEHVVSEGEIQIMSAGTGIAHSEFNHSKDQPVNFLQIWVLPKVMEIKPRYGQVKYDLDSRRNFFHPVIVPLDRAGAGKQQLAINQDAFFNLAKIEAGQTAVYDRHNDGSLLYVFVIGGEVEINGDRLEQRDALGLSGFGRIEVRANQEAKVLLMEVAP